jgi:hypothetical protein
MPRPIPLLIVLAALTVPAALPAQNTTRTEAKAPANPKRDPDLITQAEIAAAEDIQNAYDLVKRLRPNWLHTRGPSSIHLPTPEVQVYINEVQRGSAESLRDLQRTALREIRHLRGPDATQRFGTGHENGAILVIIK